jgi:hypothetical protein
MLVIAVCAMDFIVCAIVVYTFGDVSPVVGG